MRSRLWQVAGWLAALAGMIAGCASSPTATPEPTAAPAPAGVTEIVLTADSALGGLSATVVTTTFHVEAGTFTIESTEDGVVREGAVDPGALAAVTALVDEVGFFDLETNYIPEDGTCCDLIAYVITVTKDGQTHSVRASNENMPDGFRTLLRQLQALTGG